MLNTQNKFVFIHFTCALTNSLCSGSATLSLLPIKAIYMCNLRPTHINEGKHKLGPSLIAGLDCGLDRWTGLLDPTKLPVKAMMHV